MSDQDLARAVRLLGLDPADILALRGAPSAEAALEAVASLKAKARRCYKRAAFALHPDATGGDIQKAEDFRLVGAFMREIGALEPPRPQTRKRRVVVRLRAAPRRRESHAHL